jgi:hypothetical protein
MRKIKSRKFARARASNESWMAQQEDQRRAERAARLPKVPLGESVPVLRIVFDESHAAQIERLAQEASAARTDPLEFAKYMSETRAEIDAILADGAGLVEPDSELLAHGFLWGIQLHE